MESLKKYRIEEGARFYLKDMPFDAPADEKPNKSEIKDLLKEYTDNIGKLQELLYAEGLWSVLAIFQGMDAAGKDGALKLVTDSMNPQGVQVHNFKQPSTVELYHNFLWKASNAMPPSGILGIFNRSYYEYTLVCKVHPELVLKERLPKVRSIEDVNEHFWYNRFDDIRSFEKIAVSNGCSIFKIFLNISPAQQRIRLLERIKEPSKNWKFSYSDIQERRFWNKYREAYQSTISNTATLQAPWYVIPADDKEYARLLVCKIFYKHLKSINPKTPQLPKEEIDSLEKYKKELESNDGIFS